jgi:hypothetical protein
LGAGDNAPGSASKSYEVGLVRELPFPELGAKDQAQIAAITARCVELVGEQESGMDETSASFLAPTSVHCQMGVRDAAEQGAIGCERRFLELTSLTEQLDGLIAAAFGFGPPELAVMSEELEPPLSSFSTKSQLDDALLARAYLERGAIEGGLLPGGIAAETDVRVQSRRKAQVALRDPESICRIFEIPPEQFATARQRLRLLRQEDVIATARVFSSYVFGSAFGRWDIRSVARHRDATSPKDPFAALPTCPPGMLQNDEGFPLTSANVNELRLAGQWDYPLDIPWDGILPDEDRHPLDLEERMRTVLNAIWNDRGDAIERELCEILGVESLRAYFQNPAGFFADHLCCYSKSRRQAPIYWPLSTQSGSYTLWVYYHRLTQQTLYTCVNDFVEPRLRPMAAKADRLRQQRIRSAEEERELERLTELAVELAEFRDELLTWAPQWKPNQDDGVLITAAPLWKLFRYGPWRSRLRETWQALQNREYDWAHLAYSLWPDRVREKCKTDKSLAIAHGLEDLYIEPPAKVKKRAKRKKGEEAADGEQAEAAEAAE